MHTLLYFYPIETTFVRSDYELLSEKYKVRKFFFNSKRKALTPFYLILQALFLIYHCFSCRRIVSQFSGYHTFLPSVFSKLLFCKHYIILNGTECNNFPEYNYGYLQRPLLFWFSDKSLRWATKLLPVSQALVHTKYTYKDTRYTVQGYKAFHENISTPYEVVFNGISPSLFTINNTQIRKTNSFVTVATGLSSPNRRAIKGLDLILKLAELTPDYSYTFIGAEKTLDLNIPGNVKVVDFVPSAELADYYNQHTFYLQLSVSEGFGISLCEAMLCGCVPIVSNVGMLSQIAGDLGYVLSRKDVNLLKDLIEKAVNEVTSSRSQEYRKHIMRHFTLEKRRSNLFLAIE